MGAGSGRDAAWLASLGHEVIAVEPSDQMRARAQELHAGAPGITWINDRLPGLEKGSAIFDLSLVSRFAWLAICLIAIQLIAVRQIAAVRLFQAQKEVPVVLRKKL